MKMAASHEYHGTVSCMYYIDLKERKHYMFSGILTSVCCHMMFKGF